MRPWLKLRKQTMDTGTDTINSTRSTHTTKVVSNANIQKIP